jgi:predicted enzyme related to lactoylglutathione lyase
MSGANKEANRAVWFDIPVSDLDRAITFYAAVLGVGVAKESFDQFEFAVIDHGPGNGGCLVKPMDENWKPGRDGILTYLNADGRIRDAVAQVQAHGGEVLQDVHAIGPHGFCARALDPDGNLFALHSDSDA